jgi:hypothetical protein
MVLGRGERDRGDAAEAREVVAAHWGAPLVCALCAARILCGLGLPRRCGDDDADAVEANVRLMETPLDQQDVVRGLRARVGAQPLSGLEQRIVAAEGPRERIPRRGGGRLRIRRRRRAHGEDRRRLVRPATSVRHAIDQCGVARSVGREDQAVALDPRGAARDRDDLLHEQRVAMIRRLISSQHPVSAIAPPADMERMAA